MTPTQPRRPVAGAQRTHKPLRAVIIIIGLVIVFLLVYILVQRGLGHRMIILGMLPVLAAAVLAGSRGMLVTWAAVALLVSLLLALEPAPLLDVMLRDGVAIELIVLLGAGWLVARIQRRSEKQARQLEAQQTITDSLRQTQAAQWEKQQAEAALARERELSHLKDRFMTTVSHEFRTPLAIILSSSELIQHYSDRMTPERRDECLRVINRQVHHMKEMLDDIWVVLEDQETRPGFRPRPGDLMQYMSGLLEEIRSSIKNSHVLAFSGSGALSDVPYDPRLLRPIVQHVVSNAVKYSPPGSTVKITAEGSSDWLTLRVADHGMGIPAKDLPYVYDRFFRGSNAAHIAGLGLGLTVAQEMASLHLGTITIESQESQGTTVTVRLPASYPSKSRPLPEDERS